MSDDKPVVYIMRGDDRQAIEAHINNFYRGLGAPDMADMNFTRLEGKQADLNDLRSAALALPFLTTRRLVVVEDALKMVEGGRSSGDRDKYLALFDSLPNSTALVLVIQDTQKMRKRSGRWETYWEQLNQKHWLMKWAAQAGGRVYIQDCALPGDREMGNWIRKKAEEKGGSFTIMAAQMLADYVGTNTLRADQEITKLLTYVNFARPVDDDDVRRLGIQDQQSDVFTMVDAIGHRNGQKALEMLHILLEEMAFGGLFSMVVRQFRLILQAREIMDGGGGEREVARILGLQPFVARKIVGQAQKFDLGALENIYHHLQKIDLDVKTSRIDGEIALDLFITQVSSGIL